MAKVRGPLHSDGAVGHMKNRVTFSNRKSGTIVRYQRAQKDVVTEKRTTQRSKFLLGLAFWQTLPDEEKQYWSDLSNDKIVNI